MVRTAWWGKISVCSVRTLLPETARRILHLGCMEEVRSRRNEKRWDILEWVDIMRVGGEELFTKTRQEFLGVCFQRLIEQKPI